MKKAVKATLVVTDIAFTVEAVDGTVTVKYEMKLKNSSN